MKERNAKVLVVMGTRPEAIKLAPVILAFYRAAHHVQVEICVTAQHRKMLDEVLHLFNLRPDHDLDIMQPDQSLAQLNQRLSPALDDCYRKVEPDFVLVQGDTTTALLAAQIAFYRRIPVGHVEAGLRTGDPYRPFPEEMNRRVISCYASLHFTPTRQAAENLKRQGISIDDIVLSGNTVVDAVQWIIRKSKEKPAFLNDVSGQGSRTVLVTAHRRESFGRPLENICRAIRRAADTIDDIRFLFPVHPNPSVRKCVEAMLSDSPRIHLLPPQPYAEFLRMISSCDLIMTDSGGVQEEAPSFGKPVLVLRDVTERPELIASGFGKIVGTETDSILTGLREALSSRRFDCKAKRGNPFGDGLAAQRICRRVCRFLSAECDGPDQR